MDVPARSLQSQPRFGFDDFPDRFVAWLEYAALPVAAISSGTSVSRSLMRKWRAREASPSMKSANKVATALGVSAGEFFSETPWERVQRCLMSHSMVTAGEGEAARLDGVRGLKRGDFPACINRVPLDAVPVIEPGTGIEAWLSEEGVRGLTGLPLFEPEGALRFPSEAGRPAVALASLQALEVELRRWRYHLEDRMAVSRAIEQLAAVADGGSRGERGA